jgi:hypothetical protein
MLIKRVLIYALSLFLAFGSLTSLAPSALAAQGSNTGRLVGTVTNPQGEVITGATVVVTDNATGKEQNLISSSEGTFQLPQLEVGTYTVKVTAQGFKSFTANGVKIDLGREYSLTVPLEVGGATESVTVTAGADILNATTGELSSSISMKEVRELPLNGRNPITLITTQAGTSTNGSVNTSVNGQRSSFTNITRDGINIQDNFIRANATDFVPDRPNVDDVGEITITTQNAGAELGAGASQVQLVTPRGSNAFHGSAFIYNRNSELSANTFFNNASDVARPFLNRNQFGGRIGGPVVKEKLFFFFSYEGFRQRSSTSATRTILLPQARQGIFTFTNNAGVRQSVNLFSLLPASAGISGVDPLVQSRILDQTPTAGNTTSAGDQLNTTGFVLNRLQNQDRDGYTTRIDYEINQNNSLNGVYSYKKEFLLRPDIDLNTGGTATQGFTTTPFGNQFAHTHFLALAYRMNPTSRITNEIRGGLQKSDPTFGRTGQPEDFFLSIPLITSPESNFQAQGRNTYIVNLQDNAVYARGQHSFRFGGQVQFFRVNPFGPPAGANSTIPTFTLGTNTTTPQLTAAQFNSLGGISATQLATANSLVGLLGGIVSGGTLSFVANDRNSGLLPGVVPSRNLHYENWSGYISDQWRLKPNFTLNLGMRYELYTPIREPNGLALEPVIPAGTDPVAALLNPNGTLAYVGPNASDITQGVHFFKTDKNNFAPIISFAWSPEFKNKFLGSIFPDAGRTVIRGGYRESYVNDEFVRAADAGLSTNAGLVQNVSALSAANSAQLNARLTSLPAFVTPSLQVPRTFLQNNLIAGRQGIIEAIDPNIKVPRTQEYNFGIQREIGWQTAFEIRYVGSRSSNLVRGKDINQLDIFNNGFLADFLRARSNLLATGSAACPTGATNCQQLTVFPRLGSGGLLTNATVVNSIRAGTPADLAFTYIISNLTGNVVFQPNPNISQARLLSNDARFNYNSLQTELRHRFSSGLFFQANYTFQKTLTDAGGTGQTRVDSLLSIFSPELEYARADFDTTHVFNMTALYELPFGRGKSFLNDSGVLDRVVGGWELTSLIRWSTGAPLTITDAASGVITRGTFNRNAFSGRQTPQTSLNKNQIKNLIGIRKTKCGVFFIDPSVINFDLNTCTGTGRGAEGFGTTPFAGQVFFNNGPGQTGALERAFIDGPNFFNWDASIIKNIAIKEDFRVQLRLEAFNVLNNTNFFATQLGTLNINSTNFGRINQNFGARIVQLVGRIEF